MALIRCPECGKKVSDQAPACPHCGNPNVAAPAAKNPEETPAPAPKERRSHRKAILVVSIVLVLCLAAGGVWAAAKLPTMLAHKKLQGSWYSPFEASTHKLWFTFDGAGSVVCEYEGHEHLRFPVSDYPYELLSPTQLTIKDQTYEIQFCEDDTLLFIPSSDQDVVWYSPLIRPTPTPSLP